MFLLFCQYGCQRRQGHQNNVTAKTVVPNVQFPHKPYTRVVAYTFNSGLHYGDPDMHYAVYNRDSNSLAYTLKDSLALTALQTDTLLSILNDTASYVCCEFSCFDPHHAFVFYDTAGVVSAWVDVCFLCSQTKAHPPVELMNAGGLSDKGFERLGSFVKALKLEE